jgi:hypothetical protein
MDIHDGIITKANHTCSYCGFKSISIQDSEVTAERNGYMQVHATTYFINDKSALKCVCPFCYQTLNLQIVTNPTFIYFPWMSQEELNNLLLLMFSVIRMGTEDHLSTQATSIFIKLQKYKTYVAQIDQEYVKDPKELIRVLCWLSEEDRESYEERDKVLRDIRLIPTIPPACEGFQEDLEFLNTYKWYQENLREKWEEISTSFNSRFN